jgi:hypothetical protein
MAEYSAEARSAARQLREQIRRDINSGRYVSKQTGDGHVAERSVRQGAVGRSNVAGRSVSKSSGTKHTEH